MKILYQWKILLGLVLVFTAGALTGSVVTHIWTKRAFERSLKFENWSGHVLEYLDKKLKLTPEQKTKARVIVEDVGKQLQGVFFKTMEESGRILTQSGNRMDEILTPEQQAIHAEMKRQFGNDMKKQTNFSLLDK